MLEGIVIGIVVSLTVAFFGGMWARRSAPVDWFRRQNSDTDLEKQRHEPEQFQVLKEQVLEVARKHGKVLPASSTGREPTVVTLSDGGKCFYFSDFALYRSTKTDGRIPSDTIPNIGNAPLPVSQWDPPRLERWLNNNANQPTNQPK